MSIRNTLKEISRTPEAHARFLNSLSYLEYRGFRKIARSRTTEQMTLEVLTHTAEEVRHALFFKRQAVKVGGQKFETYLPSVLLAGEEIKAYFFNIDAKVQQLVLESGKTFLSEAIYYLVTWMVEVRATSVYEEYEMVLREGGLGFSLNGILREETQHLLELGEEAKRILAENDFDPRRVLAIEETEFAKLWSAIEARSEVHAYA